MNNYLEELEAGECFLLNGKAFVYTIDQKKNGDRLCIDLSEGSPRWLNSDSIIEKIAIFYTDMESNIIAIRESKKNVDY